MDGADLNSNPAKKGVGKLLRDGLVEEIPARGALPVWRRDDEARPLALRITPHGLAAIDALGASVADVGEEVCERLIHYAIDDA